MTLLVKTLRERYLGKSLISPESKNKVEARRMKAELKTPDQEVRI